jgi:hypothetical protein
MNLLAYRFQKANAEFAGTIGKPYRRFVGADDARIAKLGYLLGKSLALGLCKVATNNIAPFSFDGTLAWTAKRPSPKMLIFLFLMARKEGKDQIVPDLVSLKCGPMIIYKI